MASVGNSPSGGLSPKGGNSPGTGLNIPGIGMNSPASIATSPVLSGLKAWFKADVGVGTSGSNVTSWADQSGNGNNVVNGALSPVLTASVINGIAGITYSANTQELLSTTSSILTAGSSRTVVAVCKPGAGSSTFTVGGSVFCFRTANPIWWLGLGTTGGLSYGYSNGSGSDSITSPPAISGVPLVVEMSGTLGGAPTYVLNGTTYALSAATAITNDSGAAGFSIGNAHSASTQFFAGSICEVLVYDHVLNAGDTTANRQYLQTRFAINLGV